MRGVTTPAVTVADSDPPPAAAAVTRPPVAWLPIGSAVAAAAAVLLATASEYGFHRDELYFLMLRPAWGYVDQPPLTPLLARAAAAVFGDTPTGVRMPAVLCVGLGIVLIALIARELGGGRLAQALAAWGYAFAAVPILSGHYMVTATVDTALWIAVLLLITRALMRDEPRWWLAAGAVVGLALSNKLLIVLLLISLAIGLLAVGPRACSAPAGCGPGPRSPSSSARRASSTRPLTTSRRSRWRGRSPTQPTGSS